jgi:hypothetical protein
MHPKENQMPKMSPLDLKAMLASEKANALAAISAAKLEEAGGHAGRFRHQIAWRDRFRFAQPAAPHAIDDAAQENGVHEPLRKAKR